MFCIDASVIISAALERERYSERSKAFLDRVRREQFKVFLPEITISEVASGLMRATGQAQFVLEFVHSLRNIPNFTFVPVDSRIIDLAVEMIVKTGLRGADAIYVALAFEYHLTLITLDHDHLLKAGKVIQVQLP